MMAFEEDSVDIGDDGKPFKSEFDYEVIYFWTSHFVHGTVIALEGHEMESAKAFRVHGGKSKQYFGDTALFNVIAFIVRAFVCALRAMREEQPKVLEDIVERLRVNTLNWKADRVARLPEAVVGISRALALSSPSE